MAKRSKFQIRSDAAKKRWHVRDVDKENYWRHHIEEWRNSGLSKYAYCQVNGLSYSSFFAWIREIELRDREKAPQASASALPSAPVERGPNPFVPIRVVQDKTPAQANTVDPMNERVSAERQIEIVLPGGAVIRLDDGCNASKWLQQQYAMAQPKSSFGKALYYCLNNWHELKQYVTDGELSIDNNHTEREMKYVAMSKKAWLFLGSDEGGRNDAIVSSVLSTCRRHGVEPWSYLTDVIQRLTENPQAA